MITQSDLIAMQTRLERATHTGIPVKWTPCEHESDLHAEIEDYCKKMGWYYVHSRMDTATTTQLGVTDFIIAAPGGLTFWIEAKAKKNKPTPEQLGVGVFLKMLNHIHATVYSIHELLDVIGKAVAP